MTLVDGTILYSGATGGVNFPWLDTYNVADGDSPAPTVTQGYCTGQYAVDQAASREGQYIDGVPIVITSLTTGDVLTYDGTNWVNQAP